MSPKVIRVALTLDTDRREVRCNNEPIDLTPMEFDLLKIMAENPRVFSRMQLLDKIQGDAYEGYERTIDSHIRICAGRLN